VSDIGVCTRGSVFVPAVQLSGSAFGATLCRCTRENASSSSTESAELQRFTNRACRRVTVLRLHCSCVIEPQELFTVAARLRRALTLNGYGRDAAARQGMRMTASPIVRRRSRVFCAACHSPQRRRTGGAGGDFPNKRYARQHGRAWVERMGARSTHSDAVASKNPELSFLKIHRGRRIRVVGRRPATRPLLDSRTLRCC
jgi:hypothetical protein